MAFQAFFWEERTKVLRDEQLRVQKKTFTNWANSFLKPEGMRIEDLFQDLEDGKVLMKLLEVLTGRTIGKPIATKRRTRFKSLENVNRCLHFLKTEGVLIQNIGAEDIVDGNPNLILGLMWTIICRLFIAYDEKSTNIESANTALLLWCQKTTAGYPGVNIQNFTTSWINGLGLNALIHAHRPDLIDYNNLQPQDHQGNLKNAFNVAEKLGIAPIMDAKDVDVDKPDDKSIMTYVASYFHYFNGMNLEMNAEDRIDSEISPDVVFQQPKHDNEQRTIEDAETFKTIMYDGTYESYGNRIYLAGACNVGKSTLASLLIGDEIPLTWNSTDGLRIFFGRNGIDVKNKKMVPLNKGKRVRDVLSNVLRGRPDMKKDQSKKDVTLSYARRIDDAAEGQAGSSIAESESSKPEQSSNGSIPSCTGFQESLPTIDEHTTIKLEPKQIHTISGLTITSIHEDVKEELRKGNYRVDVAPSDLVDFGGQKSYDMTHQLFIHGKGTFTLIFDGRKRLQDPLKEYQLRDVTTESILKHWVDSILTYCGDDDDDILPVILFVATHRDKIEEGEQSTKIKEFKGCLTQMFQNHERNQRIEYNNIFFINGTDPCDPEVDRLKEKYVEIAFKQKSWGKRLPMAWVPLELQMSTMRENNISLISKQELEKLNIANGDLALTEKQMGQFLQEQHSLGQIMYFEGQGLGKYIIVQPTTLVDILRSFITDEIFWPSDRNLNEILKEMTKSGKIKKRDLFALWSQKEFHQHMPSDDFKEFIAHVLIHLDLLIEPNTRDKSIEYYLVPCAVKQVPPTMDFGELLENDKTICLSYKLLKSSIPSALSFKLIGASMNVWPLKETENGVCLYHKAATFRIDKSNTLYLLVQNDRVMVCLINETSKHFISQDVAACAQECLTLSLRSALEFYYNSFGNVASKLTIADLFNIEVMFKCGTAICYTSLAEQKTKASWKCSLGKEHETKFPLYWTYKGQNQCSSECEGLDEQCLNLCPEDKHLARLARYLEIQDLYKFVILLGLSNKDWNDFEYKHRGQGVNPLMMEIDILCHWKGSTIKPSFHDLFKALHEISYDHHSLCQILREDRTILDMSGELLQGVPDSFILSDLSRQIGNCAIHLGIELGIDFCDIQETMYDYRKMSQQNYDILKKWKEAPHGNNKTIRYLMHVLNTVSPIGLKFLKEKYKIA